MTTCSDVRNHRKKATILSPPLQVKLIHTLQQFQTLLMHCTWSCVSHYHYKPITKTRMGKSTKPCSLCTQINRSGCLHWLTPCIHPDSEDSVHLLFIVHWGFARNVLFPALGKASFLPVWYVLQQTCHVKKLHYEETIRIYKLYQEGSMQLRRSL